MLLRLRVYEVLNRRRRQVIQAIERALKAGESRADGGRGRRAATGEEAPSDGRR